MDNIKSKKNEQNNTKKEVSLEDLENAAGGLTQEQKSILKKAGLGALALGALGTVAYGGYKVGYKEGDASGHAEAYSKGFDEGTHSGLESGKHHYQSLGATAILNLINGRYNLNNPEGQPLVDKLRRGETLSDEEERDLISYMLHGKPSKI